MAEAPDKWTEPWEEDATVSEVCCFAAERVPLFLLLYAKAYREKNDAHMIENIKLLRNVVSRLDQFRRMKVRQWAKAESQTQNRGDAHE